MSHLSANIAPPISQQLFANPNSEAALKTSVKRIGCNHKLRAKMKKIIGLVRALFLCAAALTSCQVHEEPESLSFDVEFTATAPGATQSRAAVQSDGKSVWWEPGDAITVYREDGTEAVFNMTSDTSVPIATFSGSFSTPLADGESVKAIFPSGRGYFENGELRFSVPDQQKARAGTFDRTAFISYAESNNRQFLFQNVCGGVKFSVSRDDIYKVEICANNLEPISNSSKVEIEPEDSHFFAPGDLYYIVLRPAMLEKGFSITIYSETSGFGTYCDFAPREIKKSIFGNLKRIDTHISSWSKQNLPIPEPVDMGLPSGTMWASFNLGADKSEEFGFFYSWGETEPKTFFEWSNYRYGGSGGLTKYNTSAEKGAIDNLITLQNEDDAAFVAYSEDWHIPSLEDFHELQDNCTCSAVTHNNVSGVELTSKVNGNKLFFPIPGNFVGSILWNLGSEGYYWLSDLDTDNPTHALCFSVNKSVQSIGGFDRSAGIQIRAVYSLTKIDIPATGIILSEEQVSLKVGESVTLAATVTPEDATNKTIVWSSSDDSIATVSNQGIVTAINEGSASITASAADASIFARCTITVTGAETPVKELVLNKTNLELSLGESFTFKASLSDNSEITESSIDWSSNNTQVASVSSSGELRTLYPGEAIITAWYYGLTAKCYIKVSEPDYVIPEAVDLGLPSGLKWASFNVGGKKPNDIGVIYAWGEINYKSRYNWDNYELFWPGSHYNPTKYIVEKYESNGTTYLDNKWILEENDDAASMNLGRDWRMPSLAEFEELYNYCNKEIVSDNNIRYTKYTSKVNGSSIIIPFGVVMIDNSPGNGYFRSWTYETSSNTEAKIIDSGKQYRYYGLPVRAVYEGISAENLTLGSKIVRLKVGESTTLDAHLYPENTTNSLLVWTNSNSYAVKLEKNGKITGLNVDEATIIVKTNNGRVTHRVECKVKVKPNITIETPDAIDLGLPSGTKWGSFNLGATSPEESGEYFGWAQLEPYGSEYKFGSSRYDPYTGIIPSWYDVASVCLEDSWHTPTWEQLYELCLPAYCEWKWISLNGVQGFQINSKKNGNSIFLPCAGLHRSPTLSEYGESCYYWSSSFSSGSFNGQESSEATCIYFDYNRRPQYDSSRDHYSMYRTYGLPIRPVKN